ncbi:MAG: class I SAM-dependent methyltransferase, partial [Candidatus Staskawiczbacteria bacterium]
RMFNKPRLLDFGCQDGSFLRWLKHETKFGGRAQLFGYDILLKNIPENGRFYNNFNKLINSGKKFDVITVNYVLEHVLEPRQLLSGLTKNLLAEGGRIIIEVPNISFLMPADLSPTHIQHTNYFTPATLAALINKAGLSLENITALDNFILNRDPYNPGILAVGKKISGYLPDGKTIKQNVFLKRQKFRDKIKKLTNGSPIAIAGCGDSLYTILSLVDKRKIAALYDNNIKLKGAMIEGHVVRPLADAKNCPADFIIITPTYKPSSDKMKEQLSKLASHSKIITLFD